MPSVPLASLLAFHRQNIMAKRDEHKGKSTPKDEIAMKEAKASSTPNGNGILKVDGSDNSSNRKVRISEDSPAQSVKRRASGGSRRASQVTTEILGEGEVDGEKKFSPKHKDKKKQPEKSALKREKSGAKKRKASESELDNDDEDEEKENVSEDAEPETSLADVEVDRVDRAQKGAKGVEREADDEEEQEDEAIDFLNGFKSGSDDEDENGQDSSDEDEPVTVKELPEPKQNQIKAQAKGKKASVGLMTFRKTGAAGHY